MDSIEKASILMGKSYTKTQEGATHSSNVTMITGTAVSDSTDGVVSVDLGGNTISANDEQAVDISTTCAVKAGDVVQVSVIGADGTAKSLLVTGVIAGGDRMQAEVETAKDTSAAADAAAAVAKENAEKANELANSAITNANTANDQAQNAMNSVNTANGKISALQKNVDTMNDDISAAQTDISKNANDISGINQKLSTDYATKGEVSDVKVAVESEIDTKANAITASVAETYAAKSDVSKIEGELSNRISVNEKGISSTSDSVTKLQSETKSISDDVNAAQSAANAAQKTADAATADANAAQTAADNAKKAADTAQSTANGASTAAENAKAAADSANTAASNAQTAANSAQTAADNAKSAADKANSDLAKLTDTVTTQGTKINQNSGAITSVANRTTTVENKFTNYYTKTETASQIKQTADGINSTVSKKVGKDEVISSINQSAEEVKINANRVTVDGTLSVTDAISNAQTAANNAQSTANTAKNNAATAQNTANSASTAAIDAIKAAQTGTMLYTDPCFANGMNGIHTYNNLGNGNTKVERVAKSVDNPFSNTNYELKITNIGIAEPHCGGFTFGTNSRASARFIYRIIAKIPSGKPIQFVSNDIGLASGGTWKWLTSRAGTGKFIEYIVEVDCGSSGNFSTTGYFYLDANCGTPSNPIEWRVAYATCIDMTGASDAVDAKKTAGTAISNANAAQTAANNAQSAVDNIQVGGRNLLLQSEKTIETKTDGHVAVYMYGISNSATSLKKGDYVTISVQVDIENVVSFQRAGAEIGIGHGDHKRYIGAWTQSSNLTAKNGVYSFHGRINYSTTLEGDISNLNQFIQHGMYIQGSEIKFADGGYIRVSNPKLEIGNRATDWTPAPEDVQSGIDAAQSTANTTKTYFYNDSSGSHVISQNSTSAGTRTDVKADGMHVVDQDDGKELASFTSSGAAIGKDSEIHTKYSTDGIDFYEKNKSYPFTRINPVSIEKEKYSAASISSSPSDITDAAVMDDGFWHSSGAVSTSAVDGTSTDNNGWARAVLGATTVQSGTSKSASIEVFASNSNPNKGSGGVGGADNYINMTADEVYINNRAIPKIVSGTKVFHVVNTNFADLFTYDEIKQILNINSIDATKICIFVQNGDADASTIKLGNVEYRLSTNRWYVTFSESGDFYYRVNYVIVYNPEIKEG